MSNTLRFDTLQSDLSALMRNPDDAGLLSDKATIASKFFKAFPLRVEADALNKEKAVEATAVMFVKHFRLGRWDLFALLDGAIPNVNMLLLFWLLSTRIGPDSHQHLIFEGEDGLLECHNASR